MRNDKMVAIAIAVIVTAIITGFVTYSVLTPQSSVSSGVATSENIVKYNCEQSGGGFRNGSCICTEATYEKETGYCIDSFGSPGGALGMTVRKLQELEMLKNSN